jgi:MoaA/NifB/PqqE/SkfB family radical SAM enzyme
MQGRRVFLISPTYDCNLDCVYCFEKSPQDRGRS